MAEEKGTTPLPPHPARPDRSVPALRSFPLPFNSRLLALSLEGSTANLRPLSPFPVSPACPERRRELQRATLLRPSFVSPVFATLTGPPQLTEKPTTLS